MSERSRNERTHRHAVLIVVVSLFLAGTLFLLLGGSYDAPGWRRAIYWIGLTLKVPFSVTAEVVGLVLGPLLGDIGVEIASALLLGAGAVLIDARRARRWNDRVAAKKEPPA